MGKREVTEKDKGSSGEGVELQKWTSGRSEKEQSWEKGQRIEVGTRGVYEKER